LGSFLLVVYSFRNQAMIPLKTNSEVAGLEKAGKVNPGAADDLSGSAAVKRQLFGRSVIAAALHPP